MAGVRGCLAIALTCATAGALLWKHPYPEMMSFSVLFSFLGGPCSSVHDFPTHKLLEKPSCDLTSPLPSPSPTFLMAALSTSAAPGSVDVFYKLLLVIPHSVTDCLMQWLVIPHSVTDYLQMQWLVISHLVTDDLQMQ